MTELCLEGFRTRGRDSTVRQGVPFRRKKKKNKKQNKK
jgi:hypothetical protein